MIPFARIQLVGPAAIFITAMLAEAAAHALAYSPSSELLWYLNLDCFPMFQRSYYFVEYYIGYQKFQVFVVGFPCFLICYALLGKRQLPLAIATNLSFIYVGFLILSCLVGGGSKDVPFAGHCIFLLLISATTPSVIVSHIVFIRAIRDHA
jgi:hypothetical protein